MNWNRHLCEESSRETVRFLYSLCWCLLVTTELLNEKKSGGDNTQVCYCRVINRSAPTNRVSHSSPSTDGQWQWTSYTVVTCPDICQWSWRYFWFPINRFTLQFVRIFQNSHQFTFRNPSRPGRPNLSCFSQQTAKHLTLSYDSAPLILFRLLDCSV